jgi:acetylglutamate kinase
MTGPIVVKIGGSTLGSHDTTIEDLVQLQKENIPVVVVHGGGKIINDWLNRLNISTSFVNGLRVTDFETLSVVTAVLSGLVNKNLVADIHHLGGRAVGISGVDCNLITARNLRPELGYTGEELKVDPELLGNLLEKGYIPVIAPICFGLFDSDSEKTRLINVNADSAAAEIASALNADKLIFLTDVPGIYGREKEIIARISPEEVRILIQTGVASGGMAAKVEACLHALSKVSVTRIIDGRKPHALYNEIEREIEEEGTTIA